MKTDSCLGQATVFFDTVRHSRIIMYFDVAVLSKQQLLERYENELRKGDRSTFLVSPSQVIKAFAHRWNIFLQRWLRILALYPLIHLIHVLQYIQRKDKYFTVLCRGMKEKRLWPNRFANGASPRCRISDTSKGPIMPLLKSLYQRKQS